MSRSAGGSAIILLSTYRGAKHLPALLQSLFDQDWPDCRIIVRDDGSTDETRDLLRRYSAEGRLEVIFGENIGTIRSFQTLLELAPPADAIFFADQDDIWYPHKVRRAMAELAKFEADRPCLYCSALDLVDGDLVPIGGSPRWPRRPKFQNALVENIATGCTIALNGAAAELLRKNPPQTAAIMHDWWAYLVVAAFGTVIYDPEPTIAYRIHTHNQVGMPTNNSSRLIGRISRQWRRNWLERVIDQADEFERVFGNRLSASQKKSINRLLSIRTWKGRVAFAAEHEIRRQFMSDQILLQLLILFGQVRTQPQALVHS